MTDIVERLRAGFQCAEIGNRCRTMDTQSGCVCAEAADEIKRLRDGMLKMSVAMSKQIETIEKLRAALEVTSSDCKEAFADNESLRLALEVAANDLDDWGAYTKANNARAVLEGK